MSKPLRLDNGRVVLTRAANFVEWCAWREWLHRETGRTFFPEKLVVWDDWPPDTRDVALMVIGKIREAREAAKIERELPTNPEPWGRWSLNQRLDCERRHREDFAWNPELPKAKIARRNARGAPADAKLEEWWAYQIERLPKVMKGETMRAYRLRNNLRSPEYRRVKWEETPAAIPEETLTPERKAQLAKLRELATVRK